MDIWRRIRPKANNAELMVVGRMFVVFLLAISLMWVPIVQASQSGQLYMYIQSVQSYFSPPVFTCFVMGVAWGRTTEQGAFWGLIVGIAMGMLRMILDLVYPAPGCDVEDTRPTFVSKIHFLYYNCIVAFVSLSVTIIVSLLTKKLSDENVVGMTWCTRGQKPMTPSGNDRKCMPVEDPDESDSDDEGSKATSFSWWKKAFFWVCGISLDMDEEMEIPTSIREKPKWRRFVMIQALIVMGFSIAINVFVW